MLGFKEYIKEQEINESKDFPDEGMTITKAKNFFYKALSNAGIDVPKPKKPTYVSQKIRGKSSHEYNNVEDDVKKVVSVLKRMGGDVEKLDGKYDPKLGSSSLKDEKRVTFGNENQIEIRVYTDPYTKKTKIIVTGNTKLK